MRDKACDLTGLEFTGGVTGASLGLFIVFFANEERSCRRIDVNSAYFLAVDFGER